MFKRELEFGEFNWDLWVKYGERYYIMENLSFVFLVKRFVSIVKFCVICVLVLLFNVIEIDCW